MSGDSYISLTVTMLAKTEKAVRIETEDSDPAWVPRSCIHGADDKKIEDAERGDEITLRIFQWKAQAEGLV